jgi:enoyl-CoA hydratase/carnithine racemase
MMMKYVNYELDNGLAIVTVNNPPVNSLTEDMSNELRQVFEELKKMESEDALRIGLIEKLVPEGEALNEAKIMAQAMLDNAPTAIKCAKMAIDEGLNTTLKDGLLVEQKALGLACESGEPVEGAKAFLEKRKPKFT